MTEGIQDRAMRGGENKGRDVVHKIAEVETGDNDKPVEDVIIESIEVTQYHKE